MNLRKDGNNTSIIQFDTHNPNLTCIQVDNKAWSTANWNNIDPLTIFSEDCKSALGVDDELLNEAITLYPNPVTNILSVDSEITLSKIEIYSVLGKKVKEVNSDFKSIKTDHLSNGVYIVRMYSEDGMTTKKLIKN